MQHNILQIMMFWQDIHMKRNHAKPLHVFDSPHPPHVLPPSCHGTAREVQSAHLGDPAVGAPNPVAERGVDQQGPQGQHDGVSA